MYTTKPVLSHCLFRCCMLDLQNFDIWFTMSLHLGLCHFSERPIIIEMNKNFTHFYQKNLLCN